VAVFLMFGLVLACLFGVIWMVWLAPPNQGIVVVVVVVAVLPDSRSW
jgi:hypothetical protein